MFVSNVTERSQRKGSREKAEDGSFELTMAGSLRTIPDSSCARITCIAQVPVSLLLHMAECV